MNLSIGTKIKQLRRENDVTQEKLADYLNISYQAISKWETGSALPDITMVIPIANFFGITMDELFDMDTQRQEQEIENLLKEKMRLDNKGLRKESEELMRNAVQKYPSNYNLLLQYAYALDNDKSDEKISVCERILDDCTDNNIRSGAIQILTFTYRDLDNEEKAIEYANKADGLYVCKEILLSLAYTNEEAKTKTVQQTNLHMMDLLLERIVFSITYDNIDDRIFAIETAIKMWKLLIYDGNYLFYHERLYLYHKLLAGLHAQKQNKSKVIEHLKLSKYHAVKYETIPEGDHNYTTIFTAAGIHNKNYTSKDIAATCVELFEADVLHNPDYDFIKDEPEFIEFFSEI